MFGYMVGAFMVGVPESGADPEILPKEGCKKIAGPKLLRSRIDRWAREKFRKHEKLQYWQQTFLKSHLKKKF